MDGRDHDTGVPACDGMTGGMTGGVIGGWVGCFG